MNIDRLKRSAALFGGAAVFAFGGAVDSSAKTVPYSSETTQSQEVEPTQVPFVTGVDLMKWTKDRVRNPLSPEQMAAVMQRVSELGVTHVAIVTPYDQTSDGIDPIEQTRGWVAAARANNLSVSHRHMFNEAEGTYDVPENNSPEFQNRAIELMRQWMMDNRDLIQDGDTWTPMPEPQNLGVNGLNWCGPEGDKCLFQSVDEFNAFIQRSVEVSKETLEELGKNVEVVCCGFDGFVVAGDNNPDWEGKSFIHPETVEVMENTHADDHYPQPDHSTGVRRNYADYLNLVAQTWPNAQCYLTEVGHEGAEGEESIENMFQTFRDAAGRNEIRGVWFWFNSEEQLWDEETFQELKVGFAELPSEVSSHR